jgi:hypothetical protein
MSSPNFPQFLIEHGFLSSVLLMSVSVICVHAFLVSGLVTFFVPDCYRLSRHGFVPSAVDGPPVGINHMGVPCLCVGCRNECSCEACESLRGYISSTNQPPPQRCLHAFHRNWARTSARTFVGDAVRRRTILNPVVSPTDNDDSVESTPPPNPKIVEFETQARSTQMVPVKPGVKARKNKSQPHMSQALRREVSLAVDRAIHVDEEIKHFLNSWTDINPTYPTSILSPTVLDLRVTVPLGTGSQARIGEKIRLKRANFMLNAWVPNTFTYSPLTFRVIFCKLRGTPNAVPTLAQLNSMKRTNTQAVTTGTYSSTKTTQLMPYNTENWIILATHDFKIGLAAATTTNTANPPNNDFNLMCSLNQDCSRFYKSTILFDDSGSAGNVQYNDGLFLVAMCLDYQELVGTSSATTLRFDAVLDVDFCDA